MISWYRTKLAELEINEVVAAIRAEKISQGSVTEQFESEIAAALGVPYAIATTSGSVALALALMALKVGPGDEVIVPNRTFIATAHAVLLTGAKVVLSDCLPDSPCIDPAHVARLIGPRTKAIIPVHLNGRSADMRRLREIARKHDIKIVEDAAQAIFSRNSEGFLGAQSDIGCFSLGVTKLLTTGQGGLAITKSEEIYQRLKLLRNHGVENVFETTFNAFGFNFKFTDIAASIGLVQLHRSDELTSRVLAIYERYMAGIGELKFIKAIAVNVKGGEIPPWFEVAVRDRKKLQAFLHERDILSRAYLPNLHLSPHLHASGEYPNSNLFHDHGLMLPSGPAQTDANIDAVIAALQEYGRRYPEEVILELGFPEYRL